jgi:hypothetical protein
MPVLKRPDGEIHYQTFGKGFPVLLFAPGGLRSRMEMWPAPPGGPPRPWVEWTSALPEAAWPTNGSSEVQDTQFLRAQTSKGLLRARPGTTDSGSDKSDCAGFSADSLVDNIAG